MSRKNIALTTTNLPRTAAFEQYAVSGYQPLGVADWNKNRYAKPNGSGGWVACDFSELFTFTRASRATYLDADGVLQTASSGVPRINAHRVESNGARTNIGLLLESEGATNLLDWSDDLTEWPSIYADVSFEETIFGMPFYRVVTNTPVSSTFIGRIQQFRSLSTGIHTWSTFSKENSDNEIVFLVTPIGGAKVGGLTGSRIVIFDTTTETFTTQGLGAGSEVRFQNVGLGVYRVILTFDVTVSGTVYVQRVVNTQGSPADNGSYFIAGPSQLETGSIATSHILTEGSTESRAAEVLTIAGTDIPVDLDGKFSVVMKGLVNYADGDSSVEVVFFRQQVDANNSVRARLRTDVATHDVAFDQVTSGVTDTVSGGSFTPGQNIPFAIASRHSDIALNGAVNETLLIEDGTVTALADLSTAGFEVAPTFNGVLSQVLIFGEDIGDAAVLLSTQDQPPAAYGPELIPNGRLFLGAKGNTPPTGAAKAGSLTQYARHNGGLRIDRNGEGATDTVWGVTVEIGKTYSFRCRVVDLDGGNAEFHLTKSGGVTVASVTITSASDPMIAEIEFTADDTVLDVGIRPSGSATVIVIDTIQFSEKL